MLRCSSPTERLIQGACAANGTPFRLRCLFASDVDLRDGHAVADYSAAANLAGEAIIEITPASSLPKAA
jgi:hypothetical protein